MKNKPEDVFAMAKVEFEITKKTIADLFCCAIEGGSNYWCEQVRPLDKDDKRGFMEYMLEGFYCWEQESHDDKPRKRKVTPNKIKEAIEMMEAKYQRHLKDALLDDGVSMDADTGDVFLQLCCFGDVIYG